MKQVVIWILLSCLSYKSQAQQAATSIQHLAAANDYQQQQIAAFEENKGQVCDMHETVAKEVKYRYQKGNLSIFLLPTGMAYQFNKLISKPTSSTASTGSKFKQASFGHIAQLETYRMDMRLIGANPTATIKAESATTGVQHYHNKNILDIRSFQKITYQNIYDGIDWVIYTTDKGIKYDFVVHPQADPNQIQLVFEHQESIELNKNGGLELSNALGHITEEAPVSFQGEQVIPSTFKLTGNRLQFELDHYDPTKPLVIDPNLIWATYYGGIPNDRGYSCTLDQQGNIYLAGTAFSTGNIAAAGHQMTLSGASDAFLAKFNPNGTRIWATYYGGISTDEGYDCAVDPSGNVYLAGATSSPNNISFNGFRNNYSNNTDLFLAKFNPNGTRLWATYYGSPSMEQDGSCAVDQNGNVYLAGSTSNTNSNFIFFQGDQLPPPIGVSAFLVKFDSAGNRQWGTHHGGSATYGNDCAVDGFGMVYLVGTSTSTNRVGNTSFVHQPSFGGGLRDAYITRYSAQGNKMWSSYYGGNDDDYGYACAVDQNNEVYLVGATSSSNNIASNGHQSSLGSTIDNDGFIVKFSNIGQRRWGSYYGGNFNDEAYGCATGANNTVYITGVTISTTNIAANGHQNSRAGVDDAFLAKFTASGVREWGSYYGGTGNDEGYACAVDQNERLYVAGNTRSSTGIELNGQQDTLGGATDAFLAKFRGNFCVTVFDTIQATACNNYSYNGQTYSSSGVYLDTLATVEGCDSVVMLNLTINPPASGLDVQTACSSYTWLDGNTYTSSNNTATFTLVGGASNGCDSIVTLNLTINQPANGVDVQTACSSYTWLDGNTYTSSNNTATFTLVGGASNGCDSIVTLDLTINQLANGLDVQTACGSYTWLDGSTYTSSNNTATFTLVGGASNGCDSIVTLNLTINQPANGVDVQTACGSYTWLDGNTYTSSNNTATFTLAGGASNGCDSVVTLNLTINQPANGIDVQTACGSYTWLDGNTYTSSNNTATFTLAGGASNGCDSIVTLNLTINQPANGIDVQTACSSYTWLDGNTYTSSNNTATFTLVGGASNGCDSIVTLNLTINNINTSITLANDTLMATTTGANYQWIDCTNSTAILGATNQQFIPTTNGDYAVIISQNACVDTSNCITVVVVGLEEMPQSSTLIYPNPFKDVLQVNLGTNTEAKLSIINVNGQLVRAAQNLTATNTSIDLGNLSAGVYWLTIQSTKGLETYKMIKQ